MIIKPTFFRRNGVNLIPLNSNWELGSSADRLAKVWSTALDVTNITIGGVATGNFDLDGNSLLNIGNTGLQIQDTNASHVLTIKPGSDLTANKTLTLTTGDADRTITLAGDTTLDDWFDQSVKSGTSPTFDTANITGVGGQFTVANISGATFTTIQHMQDIFHSSGWTSGGGITNDGDGTITVAAGTGLIRATDSSTAEILFTDWSAEAGANVNLTDNDISYVYVEYNAGSPRVIATTTIRTDTNTNFLIGLVQRTGTTLHINTADKIQIGDHAAQMVLRLKDTAPFAHTSGGILSETGTRNIALTAGSFWQGLTSFTTSALDTAVSGSFSVYYGNGSGGFTKIATQTQIDNTQYDDGDGTLGTLSNNKYGVHWVYLEADDDDVAVVYGTGDYTLQEAQDATAPASLPELLIVEGILAGKIIIKKSASTFTQIESAFEIVFSGSLAADHGNLAGLSDDDHTQYLLADATRGLSANWDVGVFTITGTQFISDIVTGTAPLVVASTTEVANLKAATATLATTVTTNANLTGIVTSSGNATAIADKAIAIAKLADGVDGELITWDATGVIATVSVGSSGEVLTSGGVGVAPTFQAVSAGVPTAITVADESADTSCFVAFFTAVTGDLGPKTGTNLTFNSNTGILTATGFSGPLTGQADTVGTIAGLAPDTATTQATQAGITSAANLATVGILASGSIASGFGTINIGTSNALSCGTIELGHADQNTLSGASGVLSIQGVVIPTISSTNTLTNKRVTQRVTTEASSGTPTINTDNSDTHSITALATNITNMTTNLSGTPTNFQKLIIRFLDNGTGRTISWSTGFEDNGEVLPVTTTANKLLTVGFIYDTASSKWGCVAVADET